MAFCNAHIRLNVVAFAKHWSVLFLSHCSGVETSCAACRTTAAPHGPTSAFDSGGFRFLLAAKSCDFMPGAGIAPTAPPSAKSKISDNDLGRMIRPPEDCRTSTDIDHRHGR